MAGRGLLCRNLHHVLDLLGPLRARVRERRAQAAHLPAEAAQDWAEHASCRDLGVARQCCLDALLRDMAPDGDQIAYQYNIFCKTMDCLEQDTSTTRFTHRHPLVQDSSRFLKMRCQFCAKQTVLTGTDEQCGNCVQCNSQAVKKVATDVVMWF